MRLSIVDGDGGRASNARKIRTGARPILRTSHFSLEKIFLEKKMEDFQPPSLPPFLPAEISDSEERKERRLDRRQRGIILSTVRSLSTVLVPGKG